MPRQRESRLAVYLRMPIAMKLALEVMHELEHERPRRAPRPREDRQKREKR